MRFLQLDLRDYGPFLNAAPIPLDRGSLGLHLIQGPNEAGKSTAVRAIRALLFGFPKSTGDSHGRDYGSLRISGTIRGRNGAELSFVRRKRDVRPLWTSDDSAPIAPDSLLPFLGSLDEDRFLDLFSMDHAELVAGGRSILGDGGRLGEMLFAAGSGLAPVDEVRRTLDEEMDRLFRPRASTSSINAALVGLAEGRRAVDRAMLATSAWVDLDTEIARGRRRLAEVEGEWRQADAEKRRLERLRKALPKIARREDAALKLERLGGVPVLSEGFAELRRAESLELDIASKEARDSASAIEEIGRELAEIGPPDPVLAEADAIGQLQRDLGVYLKEARERPAREAKLAYIEANARSRMSGLFPGGSVDDPGRLRSLAARKGLIQELAQQFGLLEASCRKAEADVARLVDSLSGIGDEPPAPDAPRLAKALAESVSRITAQGDLDRQLADALAELAEADQEAAIMLRALPLWSGSLDDLEALAVPSPATIDRFESDLRGLEEAIGRAGASLAQFEADRLAIEREMDGVQLAGRVPTEEELEACRSGRDNTWRLVRRAWLEGHPVGEPLALATGYEADVRSADELADRLRREADRVAAQAQRRATHRGLLARIAALAEDLDRKRVARAAALDDWAGFWKPLGIDPLPPREMRDWVKLDRDKLVQKVAEIRGRRARADRLAGQSGELRAELGRGLTRLGEPPVDPLESLAAILDRARSAIARVDVALRLGAARSDRSKAETALGDWKARWAAAVEPLGLGGDASTARANAVLAEVDELIKAVDEMAALRGSIDESLRLERRFEAAVEVLRDRLKFEVIGDDVEAVSGEIKARLDAAREARTRREGLLKRELDERAKLEEAGGKIDRARLALDALVREARCDSPEGLPDAERASDEVKQLKTKLRELDEQLEDLADADSVDQLRREAGRSDAASLDDRIATLADRLAPLEAERNDLLEEIGRCSERLKQMDGGPAAADAQQAVEERMAHLALDVERYARLRLASAVLREAVERYRKEHQGPVLDRAGALFASLTAGSFAGVRPDVDEKGQPVLLGVRADGTTLLKAEAMSEGTADQLYLALRLASLQTYLDDHEPMPLVVDDILVNFDNARALAALRALADLSKRTQVLFFTHHDHLVDLARSALGEDVLFVHHLAHPPAGVNGHHEEGPAVEAVKPKRKRKATPLAGEG